MHTQHIHVLADLYKTYKKTGHPQGMRAMDGLSGDTGRMTGGRGRRREALNLIYLFIRFHNLAKIFNSNQLWEALQCKYKE